MRILTILYFITYTFLVCYIVKNIFSLFCRSSINTLYLYFVIERQTNSIETPPAMNTPALFTYFATEMRNNSSEYVYTTCNQVNLTLLAEGYLLDHEEIEVGSDDETTVFDAAVDWYNQWTGKTRYN